MRLQGPNPTRICAVIRASALCKPIRHDGGNEDKRIATEEEFRERVVDRDFTGEARALRYTADGRMTGVPRDRRVEGAWSWVGDTLCRTATWGSRSLGHDCQAILVIGELVIVVRDRGRGRAFALRSGPAVRSILPASADGSDAMNFDRLVRELRGSFHSAPRGDKAVTVHLFGIRYADEIRACGSTVDSIVLEADLPASYAGEIRKAMRIARHVTLGRDTRRKAPARSPLSGTVLAPAPDE